LYRHVRSHERAPVSHLTPLRETGDSHAGSSWRWNARRNVSAHARLRVVAAGHTHPVAYRIRRVTSRPISRRSPSIPSTYAQPTSRLMCVTRLEAPAARSRACIRYGAMGSVRWRRSRSPPASTERSDRRSTLTAESQQ